MEEFIDVNEEDLVDIYEFALEHAESRQRVSRERQARMHNPRVRKSRTQQTRKQQVKH